ncbi:MAG TPA: metallophosphoesterase family protein [Solirubrobacteraceae bacterium]|nr:metallophosphoesterase family protein [Solirubrobacteraceae bacterium]
MDLHGRSSVAADRLRAARRPAALVALCALLALGGLLVGLRLATPGEYETALGRVSVGVTARAHGTLEAYVPLADWGVRVHPFSAPLKVHVEARTVDREQVVRAASGDGALVTTAKDDLAAAVRHAVLRTVRFALGTVAVVALVLGLVLAAAGVRSRAALVGAPALVLLLAGAVAGGTLLRAHATLRDDALDRPTFYARGAELVQLLDAAEHARQAGDGYTSKVEGAVRGFASLLSQPGAGQLEGTRPALLVSDLHDNRFALDSLRAYAAGKTVFFVGDFGTTGSRAEAGALAGRVARLGRRVVAVSGNHDSTLFMRALQRRGVTVLTTDGGMARADGLTVAGFDDPMQWRGRDPGDPRRIFSFSELPGPAQAVRAAQRRLLDWFDGLPRRPDVVLVHQNGLAQFLGRTLLAEDDPRPLTILTGHDHRQHVTSYGAATVVDAGTVGASGLYGVGRDFVGLADLHFSGRRLEAADLVGVEPVSGAAEARRAVIAPCAQVCERAPLNADAGSPAPGATR